MRVIVEITGQTGLVMHNIRLADRHDPFTRAIAELTSKGSNRTEADDLEIERLEWHGGIYHDAEIGPYVPTWNVVRCMERAGAITRKGTAVVRALAVVTDKVPVQYDGPRDLPHLWEKSEFRHRATVGIQRNKITRMRPIFRRWRLELEAEFLPDVLNPTDFDRIAEQAGRSEGLGDARKLGYGRFTVEVHR